MEHLSPAELADVVGRMAERHDADGTLPPIVQLGHPALRAGTPEYRGELGGPLLAGLLRVMRATMHAAPGVGLAAPQIGLPLRIAVLEDRYATDPDTAAAREREPLEYLAMVNPTYAPSGPETVAHFEGCLSFAGFTAVVERPRSVAARWHGADGLAAERVFSGWQARIVQHETDHLRGTVYIDRAATRSLCTTDEYLRRWAGPTPQAAREGLRF